MPKIDCWRLLGLPPGARADQVRAAFAQRARDVHPDGGGSGDGLTMRTPDAWWAERTLSW